MNTSPAAGGIAPGWYQDPGGQLRWWDGSGWTGHVAPPQAPQPPPQAPQPVPPSGPQSVPQQQYARQQPMAQRAPMVLAPPRRGGPLQDRRVLTGVGALVAAAVLGGAAYLTLGGSSTGGSTTAAGAPTPAHRAAVPAGEEHKTAAKVVADAKSALFNAGAVHISQTMQNGTGIEMQLQDDDVSMQMNGNGFNATIIRKGSRVFVRGTERFWSTADARLAASAPRLAGRWIELQGTSASTMSDVTLQKLAADLVDPDVVLDPKVEPTTLDGKDAVIVSQHNGTQIWVADTGPALPLKVVDAKDHSTSTLSDFGVRQAIEAPEGAVLASEALKAAPATA